MNPLTALRFRRDEDDPFRSPSFSTAEPDAIANPLTSLRQRRTTSEDRRRVDDELYRRRFVLDDIPGTGALKSLYTGGKALHTAASKLIPGLGKAADVGERVAIKPAVPSETVEKVAGYLPGAKRESRLLGRLAKDVELGIPSLLALNPLVDFGVTPKDIQVAQKQAKPVSPAKAIAGLHEIAAPTIADIATGGASKVLGGGLFLAGAIGDAGKGRKAAKEAKRLVKELEAVKETHIPPTTKFSRFGGAIEPIEPGPPLPPRSPTTPFPDLPERPGGVGRGEVALAELFRTSDDFLRESAGKAMIPRESAEGMANAARNLQYDTQVKSNEGARVLDGLLGSLKKIKGETRVDAEKAMARRLDTGATTGSEGLDKIADGISEWLNARYKDTSDALAASGGKAQLPRQFYLPHRNERLGDALRAYEKDPRGAVDQVEALYRESGTPSPPREELTVELDRLYRAHASPSTGGGSRIASKSQHIEEARTLDIPGFVADYRRPDFQIGELVRALEGYNQETAFRIADARHFGADAQKFTALHDAVGNESVKEFMRNYRSQLIGALSDDPLEAEAGKIMAAIRSYQAANKLGRAAIANLFQTGITTLPKSLNTIGYKGLVNYWKAWSESLPALANKGEALEVARKAGAVYDHSVADIAGISHKGFFGRLADKQLQLFGFVPTERFNNTVSFHAGRLYGEDLAQALAKGNKQAATEARRLLAATPEVADQFMAQALAGQPIADDILDRMGFEFARTTQFRADPTTLPLAWVTPYGKTIVQFKNFGYQYSRFLKNDVFGPALRGDVAPLVAWTAAGGISGPAITWARRAARDPVGFKELIEGDERARKEYEDAVNAEAVLQSFGLWGDAANSVRRAAGGDFTAPAEFALGPTAGEIVRTPKELAVYKEPVDEYVARRLPVGPFVPLAEYGAKQSSFSPPQSRSQGNPLTQLRMRYRP